MSLAAVAEYATKQAKLRRQFEGKYSNWEQFLSDLETEEATKLIYETGDKRDKAYQQYMVHNLFADFQYLLLDQPLSFETSDRVRRLVHAISWIARAYSSAERRDVSRQMKEIFADFSKIGNAKREAYIKELISNVKKEGARKQKEVRKKARFFESHAKKFIGRQLSNDQKEKYLAIAKALRENKKKSKPRRESEVINNLVRINRSIFHREDDPAKLRKSYDIYLKRHPQFLSSVR